MLKKKYKYDEQSYTAEFTPSNLYLINEDGAYLTDESSNNLIAG